MWEKQRKGFYNNENIDNFVTRRKNCPIDGTSGQFARIWIRFEWKHLILSKLYQLLLTVVKFNTTTRFLSLSIITSKLPLTPVLLMKPSGNYTKEPSCIIYTKWRSETSRQFFPSRMNIDKHETLILSCAYRTHSLTEQQLHKSFRIHNEFLSISCRR